MDADLFSPRDAAALLAIRAVVANRTIDAAELAALFSSTGLVHEPCAVGQRVQVLRNLLSSDKRR